MASGKPRGHELDIRVVTTPEHQRDAFLVRAVCYAGGKGAPPVSALVDGNDYQATHFVAYANGEPVGSARVRWFRDFAKFERSCFVPAYRNTRAIYATAARVFDHIARKGYDRVYTVAAPKYAELWRRLLGFELTQKPPFALAWSSEPFVELVKRLGAHGEAITACSDSALLERIEGVWDARLPYEL